MTKISDLKPGDRFEVMLGGKPRMTYIDKAGTQRFEPNEAVAFMLVHNNYQGLNELAAAYHTGRITFDDYLEYQLSHNYSVDGFCELSSFSHLDIRNPLWEDDAEITLAPAKYLGSNLIWPITVEASEEGVDPEWIYRVYPAMMLDKEIIGCSEKDCTGYAVAKENYNDGGKTAIGIFNDFEGAASLAVSLANNILTDHQKSLLTAFKFL